MVGRLAAAAASVAASVAVAVAVVEVLVAVEAVAEVWLGHSVERVAGLGASAGVAVVAD